MLLVGKPRLKPLAIGKLVDTSSNLLSVDTEGWTRGQRTLASRRVSAPAVDAKDTGEEIRSAPMFKQGECLYTLGIKHQRLLSRKSRTPT